LVTIEYENLKMMIIGQVVVIVLLLIGNTMDQYSSERQLLLFGIEKNPVLVDRQLQLLNLESKAVKDRSLVITVVPKGDPRIMKYSINSDQFTILLIGKDNMEKHRTNTILPTDQLFGIIDAMPMRKAEMKSSGR
jgi:Domain of unknown function (DUF4174)